MAGKVVAIIIASVMSGVLYRLGGMGKPYNTKYRDIGCPLVSLGLLAFLGGQAFWWVWLICFLWMFGAMTTYCKIGYQEDVYWYNWLLTGLHYGVCMLAFAWQNGSWAGLIIRIIFLGVAIMVWSEMIDDDDMEEFGRGALNTTTISLLLI